MFFLIFDQKKSKENQKKTPKNADPNPPACTYMGLAILFVLFSRFFLVFDQKKQKTGENQKKMQTLALTHQLVPTWVLQFWLVGFRMYYLCKNDDFSALPG